VFLALRGLRTLKVRLDRHQQSGLEVAAWARRHPLIADVFHPALPSSPGHAVWKRDFTGASGLFSILLPPGTRSQLAALVDGMRLFKMGFSWGGYESLILPTNIAKVRTATPWTQAGPLLRLSIGLEGVADLIADLDSGLNRYKAAG
jgi:cysteine-S-conjugate beta-lyase